MLVFNDKYYEPELNSYSTKYSRRANTAQRKKIKIKKNKKINTKLHLSRANKSYLKSLGFKINNKI